MRSRNRLYGLLDGPYRLFVLRKAWDRRLRIAQIFQFPGNKRGEIDSASPTLLILFSTSGYMHGIK